ncbi:MAG: archaemetzincin [Crocinitomix sp.]|jgi:archaemetzincin
MKRVLIIVFVLAVVGSAILIFFPKSQAFIGIDTGPPLIGIQPYGNIADREVDSVKSSIEKMYGFEVVILNRVVMPEMAYTEIRYPRYRADSLLKWTTYHHPDTIDIAVGLTNQDISITKYKGNTKEIKDPEWMYKDFGIFGLGSVGGTSCVVSSNRLHKKVSDKTFYRRLMRITCHEVGHVLGLRHCPEPNCLMNDANESIKTIDKSTGDLCDSCWADVR